MLNSCFGMLQRRVLQIYREKVVLAVLWLATSLAILTTVAIVGSLFFEAYRFFEYVPFFDFLFGLNWNPTSQLDLIREDPSQYFGLLPLLSGTLLITLIAMCVAVPIGLFSAIALSEYLSIRARKILKPCLEILAGIPTVVYGFFAALTIAPMIKTLGQQIGLDVASENALAAGTVMGMMIIPFICSLSDDVLHAVPHALRDSSYALGTTKSETIKKVILPAALPGIIASILLAVSRAIGETMIVVMAAGLRANLTINPLQDVTTITVQIVTLLTGDQEFDSPKTLSAFAIGLVLFFFTLMMNFIGQYITNKYREAYD